MHTVHQILLGLQLLGGCVLTAGVLIDMEDEQNRDQLTGYASCC